jgi:hypothetical protein
MKSKAEIKKTTSGTGASGKPVPPADELASHKTDAAKTENVNEDEDLPDEHLKGLDEALKGADRGEPVTLKEFKKMAKKWSAKDEDPKP